MKADVLTIPKMWYFSSFKGFEPELLAVKVESNFGKSARFQVPKNGTLSAQIFERMLDSSQPGSLRYDLETEEAEEAFLHGHESRPTAKIDSKEN